MRAATSFCILAIAIGLPACQERNPLFMGGVLSGGDTDSATDPTTASDPTETTDDTVLPTTVDPDTGPMPESCGDGVTDADEECDDGNDDDGDACRSNCVMAACHDGVVYVGIEPCDDGNEDDTDE